MAGKDWFKSFMKRHPKLSLKKPESLSVVRVKGMNKESVDTFSIY